MSSSRRQTYSYVDEWKSLWEPDLKAIAYNGITCDPTKVDPKVLLWARRNCAHKPHFVKVISTSAAHGRPRLHTRNSSYLYVPTPFVQEHFRELERVVTLENDNGRTWRVSFGSPQKHPRWVQGWHRVARDNSLTSGDVIVFVLVRNSCFRFKIFDENGNIVSEKRNPTLQNDAVFKKEPSCFSHSHHELTVSDVEEHSKTSKTRKQLFKSEDPCPEEAEYEEQTAEPPRKKRRLQKLREKLEDVCQLEGESGKLETNPPLESFDPFEFIIKSRRRETTALERHKTEETATSLAKALEGRHVVSVMSETHVYRDFHLVLPDYFVPESSLPTVTTLLKLLDCDGNSWDMKFKRIDCNQAAYHRKLWALFALHHLLEEGDVCVFELKETEERTALVHIFRVVPLSLVDKISIYAHYDMRKVDET